MITEEIKRSYLEIKSLNELSKVEKPNHSSKVVLIDPPDFQLNKFFYKQIGNKHKWRDRLIWEDRKWIDYTTHSNVKTFILKKDDDLIGYFELIFDKLELETEIAYFGILENYFGKKYGGYLLSEAIKISFEAGSKRIWVHTCSLDHKNGIKNYLARGMKIFKSEKITLSN